MGHELFKKAELSFKKFLIQDSASLGRSLRRWAYFPRVLSFAVIEFYKNSASTMAAALAYTTILSLVPVCALAVLYTKIAGKLDAYSSDIQDWILKSFVAESAQGIIDYINQFIANLHTSTLGTIGVGGLLFTAYSMLLSIEKSLNRLWKVKRNRSSWSRFQMLCSILIVVPAFLAGSFYISGKVQMTSTLGSLSVLVPLALTTISLFFIFKAMPNTFVSWRFSLFAAAIAALLLETGKIGFNFYVVHLVSVQKIYGSLGLVPVLLIWIYLSWIIVLFGVELSYAAQNLDMLVEEANQKERKDAFLDSIHEERGLFIAKALAKRFRETNAPVSLTDLSQNVLFSSETVLNHLEILIKSGLVAETLNETGYNLYVFSRPLDHIHASDVMNAFRTKLRLPALKPSQEKI